MRFPVFVTIVIALISFGREREYGRISAQACPFTVIAENKYSDKRESIEFLYLNVRDKGIVNAIIWKQYPYLYIVFDEDTFKSHKLKEVTDVPNGEDERYFSTEIYNAATLQDLFNENLEPDSTERLLIEFKHDIGNLVASARVRNMQLDNDLPQEKLVHIDHLDWQNHYLVYDSTDLGWHFLGQVSMTAMDWGDRIDLSVNGFFGFENSYHAMCDFGVIDYVYYRIENDTIRNCFTINNGCFQSRLEHAGNKYCYMDSESKSQAVGNKILVNYTIKLGYECFGEQPCNGILDASNYHYYLIETADHKFVPDREIPKCYNEYCDTAYFYPESYALKRLDYLKYNGSFWQKSILQEFKYDSTMYFRF